MDVDEFFDIKMFQDMVVESIAVQIQLEF